MHREFFVLLVVCLTFVTSNSQKADEKTASDSKLNVTVYYESLCPGSQVFFTKQLYPVWQRFQDDIRLELVPYGSVKQYRKHEKWTFECRHGSGECHANKIQGCIMMSEDFSLHMKMALIKCLMENEPDSYLLECSSVLNVDAAPIESCANSSRGDNMFAMFGHRTRSVTPKMAFIPSVAFNEKYDPYIQNRVRDDLESVICELAENEPEQCIKEQVQEQPGLQNIVLNLFLNYLFTRP